MPNSASKPPLPLRQYFALQSYLSTLLLLSVLFLPRSSHSFFNPTDLPLQRSSADRPEHPFLTPLTVSPRRTMLWILAGMTICMLWWGHHLRTWVNRSKTKSKGTSGEVKSSSNGGHGNGEKSKNTKRIKEAFSSTVVGSAVIMILLLILGSPMDSHLIETYLLSLHLSCLLVWPIVHSMGIPSMYDPGILHRYQYTKLFSYLDPETPVDRALLYPALGTMVGAWIGALPLPLDWDRPWQSYPLTLAFGSVLGFIIGGWVSFLHSATRSLVQQVQSEKL
ncbi:hypothetical protein TREMEDRAFT_30320 [Tremella mesenterica DSM 1558]|uniref:uncharacterized protein n=1 Tax=Tremella mesenterica (strain ATCC 24925 / CBS 8224 / DSM 1558 / NBRC 9311 / NRRL Y-6157 / RJB 2259-6 / UBC 559-6) TaxID=578456 RepID=UPI0003F4A372|nr:uncharacterized protein TREMEDRAFT_30320 [Tremella mesenterica DSM 1558]EIW70207.1 hypothetical protein TREMEDRAFT_30320 [Tremella mesenterica DSM 1558]